MTGGRKPDEASGLNDDSDDHGSGLDDLFAEDKFIEYEGDGLNPFVAPAGPIVPVAGAPSAVPLSVTPVVEWPSSEPHDTTAGPPALPSRREQRLAEQASSGAAVPGTALPGSTQPPIALPAAPQIPAERVPAEQPHPAPAAPLVRPRSNRRGSPAGAASASPPSRRAPLRLVWASLSTLNRSLVIMAGVVLLALLLVGLFALGQALSSSAPDDGAGGPVGAEDPGTGPLAPGDHAWNALRGGECVDPYDTVWAEEFTVVDCAQPHAAQLVSRGVVGPDVVEYPALDGWQALVPTLCDTTTLLDLEAAGVYADLQVELGYPGTVEAWDGGDRDCYCFVSRSAGEPIEGSLVAPPAG